MKRPFLTLFQEYCSVPNLSLTAHHKFFSIVAYIICSFFCKIFQIYPKTTLITSFFGEIFQIWLKVQKNNKFSCTNQPDLTNSNTDILGSDLLTFIKDIQYNIYHEGSFSSHFHFCPSIGKGKPVFWSSYIFFWMIFYTFTIYVWPSKYIIYVHILIYIYMHIR